MNSSSPYRPVPELMEPGTKNRLSSFDTGISIQQQAMMTFMAAMLGNPHYAPLSFTEIAAQARDATQAYCTYASL